MAGAMPELDASGMEEDAQATFSAAMPLQGPEVVERESEAAPAPTKASTITISINNQTIQADDIRSVYDFMKAIMQSVNIPEAVAV
jgi:hypothetical protein